MLLSVSVLSFWRVYLMFWGYWTTTGQVRVNMLWYNLQVCSEISTGCLSSNKNCDYKVTDGAIITKVITEAAKLENQLTCCLLTSHTHTNRSQSHDLLTFSISGRLLRCSVFKAVVFTFVSSFCSGQSMKKREGKHSSFYSTFPPCFHFFSPAPPL